MIMATAKTPTIMYANNWSLRISRSLLIFLSFSSVKDPKGSN